MGYEDGGWMTCVMGIDPDVVETSASCLRRPSAALQKDLRRI